MVLLAACGAGNGNGNGNGDGNGDGPDAGTVSESCGDGTLDPGEACDDGNTIDLDGCSATCEVETSGLPCAPNSYRCGPGNVVEFCNNAGTAWLFVESCSTGCAGGACTDPTCAPGARRCHGAAAETCNASGTGWDVTETCSTYCVGGQCAQAAQTITTNSSSDGTVIVAGDFVVTANSTLTAPTGNLTIIADNIRVDAGAAIAVSPTGEGSRGGSCYSGYPYYYWYAANYGESSSSTRMMSAYGGENDADVEPGSIGGRGGYAACQAGSSTASPTHGGGTLRLIARHDITIAGQLLAAGENAKSGDPYGGSGGGIQIAGDTITITGTISTAGGTNSSGVASGYGRVRLLYGNTLSLTGTVIGKVTQGLRPPIDVRSPTHPDPTLVYNDNFAKLLIAHERPFATAQGYLHAVNPTEHAPPQPANGTFVAGESFEVAGADLDAGENYVHLASLDASSALGSVERRFPVTINADPPSARSTSHTSPTTWYDNPNPFFAWTNPQELDDKNFRRVHYVLDHFADTVPTLADTSLPIAQKQLLVPNLAPGIWVLHVLAEDTMGYLTKRAAHVVVRVGTDPGTGSVFGSVIDDQQKPVAGAVVRVNRGLFTATTSSSGTYTINGVAAGTWEISVKHPSLNASAQMLTVSANGQASANFTLAP